MGYVKEPNGVTLIVDKLNLTKEMERQIKEFIKKSKENNKEFLKGTSKNWFSP